MYLVKTFCLITTTASSLEFNPIAKNIKFCIQFHPDIKKNQSTTCQSVIFITKFRYEQVTSARPNPTNNQNLFRSNQKYLIFSVITGNKKLTLFSLEKIQPPNQHPFTIPHPHQSKAQKIPPIPSPPMPHRTCPQSTPRTHIRRPIFPNPAPLIPREIR